MDTIALVIALIALLAGAGLGYFFGSRPVAEWRARHAERDGEAKALDDRFRTAIAELATMSERADRAGELDRALKDARAEADGLRVKIAEAARDQHNLAEREKLLVDAREALTKEFEALGNRALEGAQKRFLDRANERFEASEKANAEKIRALLSPVGERLDNYRRQVEEMEAKRVDAFGQLSGLIEGMRQGQEDVRREAARLGNSLRNAPKARGRWGEQQLKNVLEHCGLAEHTDFQLEHSINTEEGRLRPDAILRIPGEKMLVIDAKVSLNAYQSAFEAESDEARETALAQHAASMRTHVSQLSAKSYQSQFDEAPDYVVMFVPGEHFVAAALEADPTLWDFAFAKGVLLATPTNLVAIARTVAQVWRQDGLAKEAKEIGKMGGELYDRLAIAAEHMKRVGSGLETAVNNYNKFVGSFERNVLSAGRRLKDKHIEIGKREIDEVPQVEAAPRYGKNDVAVLPDGNDAAMPQVPHEG